MSRTSNSAKNILTINISKVLMIVLNFVTRTVLIKTLGNEYLGINNLFTNILQMLSLAELGVGTAIVFKLYKPIEEYNESRIIALMHFYKRVYELIGCVIVALGAVIAPFLPHLINDFKKFDNLNLNPYFIFALYVFNTASTYWFFAYKQAIVRAHQKTYMLTVSSYVVSMFAYAFQIFALIVLRDFVIYTCYIILFNIIQNFVYAIIADKYYPYVKKKTDERISKEEIKDLIKDCGALLIYKSSSAVVSASDNIIISAFLGLNAVAVFSNYSMISLSIRQFLVGIISSLEASVGSINATGNIKWKQNTFKTINFATVLIYGIISVGIFVMMDDFIYLWLGNDYLINSFEYAGKTINFSLPLLFGIEVYIIGISNFLGMFRQSFGLFRQLKWRPLFTMIINLVIGISTVKYVGAAGTVIGTIIAYATTVLIVDPIVIINTSLDISVKKYFMKNAIYAIISVFAGFASWYICSLITGEGIIHFVIKGFVCVTITSVIYFLAFFKTNEFRMLLSFLPEKIKNKLRFLA